MEIEKIEDRRQKIEDRNQKTEDEKDECLRKVLKMLKFGRNLTLSF